MLNKIWTVILLLGLCFVPKVNSQVNAFFVFEQHPVRDSLAKVWNDTTASQEERGYCLSFELHLAPFNSVLFRMTGFVKPDTIYNATPYSIGFRCPPNSLELHVHTPTTCPIVAGIRDFNHCFLKGDDAYVCYPSAADRQSLTYSQMPVGFIQCSKNALVPYFPYIYYGVIR